MKEDYASDQMKQFIGKTVYGKKGNELGKVIFTVKWNLAIDNDKRYLISMADIEEDGGRLVFYAEPESGAAMDRQQRWTDNMRRKYESNSTESDSSNLKKENKIIVPESFKVPGTEIIVKEGQTIKIL